MITLFRVSELFINILCCVDKYDAKKTKCTLRQERVLECQVLFLSLFLCYILSCHIGNNLRQIFLILSAEHYRTVQETAILLSIFAMLNIVILALYLYNC
jgi:hypothetical protein